MGRLGGRGCKDGCPNTVAHTPLRDEWLQSEAASGCPAVVFHGARGSVLTVARDQQNRTKACTEHTCIDRRATNGGCKQGSRHPWATQQ